MTTFVQKEKKGLENLNKIHEFRNNGGLLYRIVENGVLRVWNGPANLVKAFTPPDAEQVRNCMTWFYTFARRSDKPVDLSIDDLIQQVEYRYPGTNATHGAFVRAACTRCIPFVPIEQQYSNDWPLLKCQFFLEFDAYEPPTARETFRELTQELYDLVDTNSGYTRSAIPLNVRHAVFVRDEDCCRRCGRDVEDGVKLELDHKIPVSKGGSNDMENLQVLCFECNRGKRDN